MKFSHGVVIGKFYPPHKGHEYLIETALQESDCVTVIVCDVTPDPDTTNVAVRVVVSGLAAAVKVIVPLFDPVLELNVNHVG